MAKIKGWKKDTHSGTFQSWMTTERPYLQVWINNIFKNYANDGLYEVETDFTIPRRMAFKTKQEALNTAYKIMKQESMNR